MTDCILISAISIFGQEQIGEAIESYEAAVRLYDDGTNRFSLGQGYLKAGRFSDA